MILNAFLKNNVKMVFVNASVRYQCWPERNILKRKGGEKMNMKLLLPVFAILCAMLLVPVYAQTETYHFNGKVALAALRLAPDVFLLIVAGEGQLNLPGSLSPFKAIGTTVLLIDFSTSPPTVTLIDAKELAPSEFKWSFGACRVSTVMPLLGPLTVKWDTVPPTHTGHIKLKDGIHVVLNGTARIGSATVNGRTGWIGLVARGVGTVIIKTP